MGIDGKRLVLSGIAVTIFNALYGFLTCGCFFNWVYRLPPAACWRDMQNVTFLYWIMVYAGSFIVALIYTFAYAKLAVCFRGGKARKGAVFGLGLWFVAALPSVFYTFAFMNVAGAVIIYWLIHGFIQMLAIGLIIAWVYTLPAHVCCKE